MGHRIVKQPNGKYAVFSSIVDDFIILDASPQDIIDFRIKKAKELIISGVKDIIQELEDGKKPYAQFTISFDETVEKIKERHGEDTESLQMLREILNGSEEDSMKALDYMIANDLYEYHCDPWYAEPGASNYFSVDNVKEQVTWKGQTFVIQHASGHHGRGGMDEGSPNSVSITRIRD